MKVLRIILLLWIIVAGVLTAEAQQVRYAVTVYSDSFVEWELLDSAGTKIGALQVTRAFSDDWTQVDVSVGDYRGVFKTSLFNNITQWDLFGSGMTLTARRLTPGDVYTWRLTDNDYSLTLEKQEQEAWQIRPDGHGTLWIYTTAEGDLRDWTIHDVLDEEVPETLKYLALCVVLWHNAPHY